MRFDQIPELAGGQPFVGHNRAMRSDRLNLLRRVAAHPSGLVRLRLPIAQLVTVTTPDLLQELLIEKARSFEKSAMVRFTLYPLAGEGLFTSGGELWRRQRKLIAPLFHPQKLEGYADDMVACAERDVLPWRDGQVVDLLEETTRITMAVAGKTLFDTDTFAEAEVIGDALTDALAWTSEETASPYALSHLLASRALRKIAARAPNGAKGALSWASERLKRPTIFPGEHGKKLVWAIHLLDERVARMIDERRREGLTRADLLTRLLVAQDEDAKRDENRGQDRASRAAGDKQVRDEILTLFIAGHETTATGLAWSLHLLCKHPEIYAAVEREVDALGHRPTAADLPRLGLTLRVFKEALRLYAPVYMVGRRAREATTLGGYEIPADTPVMLAPFATHYREDVWPEPSRFDPDRFLPAREEARHKLAWLPFGAGPRVCIGNYFALMESQLVLATLLRHARFAEVGSAEPAAPSATLRTAEGARMRVTLRKTARMVA